MSNLNNSKIDEVMDIIRKKIEQGEYSSGERLPSERVMSEQLGVSRATIRTSLLRLQAEGLVDIFPRSGVFVRSNISPEVLGSPDPSSRIHLYELQHSDTHMQVLQQKGREVMVRFLDRSKIMPAGKEIAKQLNISPETEVFRRYRVQIVDRHPLRIMEGFYLGSLLKELCERDQELYPIQKWDSNYVPFLKWLREEKNFHATRVSERLKCRMPTDEEASILKIARIQPVVEMHRHVWGKFLKKDDKEILFEYSRFICNAALHEFQYTYDIEKNINP
ncbi:MAG: GntR family transcriptional regulator [Thermoactinomyces sp.]